jgi:integrase/recombinase XerD
MFTTRYSEAELSNRTIRQTIPPKWEVYYVLLCSGRSFGYRRTPKCCGRWVARIRVSTGHVYREQVMGLANDAQPADGVRYLTYSQAKAKALAWFEDPKILPIRTQARQIGWQSSLIISPIGSEYTVAHVMRDYCNWKRDFGAKQSLCSAVSRANVYTLPLLGSVLCRDLTAQQCRSLLLHVESSVLHRAGETRLTTVDPRTLDPEVRRKRRITANNTFTDFRSALNMAFGDGHIATNSAWRVVKLFRHVNRARADILTWQQAKRMVDIATPEFRRLVLAALYTGCRITEIFKMKVGDIDPQRAAIYIHPVKCYRGRTIALPDEGYYFFKKLADGRSNDSVLVMRDGDWPWTKGYAAGHFKKLCKAVGAPEKFVFHSLRHTYASLLLRAGTPAIVVARQLGHINMMTTLKMYAHVTDDFMDYEFRSKFKPGFLNQGDLFESSDVKGISISELHSDSTVKKKEIDILP